jgi:hypothetical protein
MLKEGLGTRCTTRILRISVRLLEKPESQKSHRTHEFDVRNHRLAITC